jgi:uncharacterized protein YjbI with pentapeptide repeats
MLAPRLHDLGPDGLYRRTSSSSRSMFFLPVVARSMSDKSLAFAYLLGFRRMRRPAHLPRRPELPAQLEAAAITTLAHDCGHLEVALADGDLADQDARGVSLESVRLTRVDLSGSRLDRLTAVDVEFDRCNLANLHGRGVEVTRLSVASSRLTGIRFSEAILRDVTIRDSRVDLASFGFSELERVTFEDCLLTQTDFLDARLESVRFTGCDLTRSDFRGARLRHCELRRCDLTDLQGVEGLRGAAMEWSAIVGMAGVFAAALGVEVLDPA